MAIKCLEGRSLPSRGDWLVSKYQMAIKCVRGQSECLEGRVTTSEGRLVTFEISNGNQMC